MPFYFIFLNSDICMHMLQEAQFPQHEEHPVFFPGKTFLTHTYSKATTKTKTMISAKFIIDTSILAI